MNRICIYACFILDKVLPLDILGYISWEIIIETLKLSMLGLDQSYVGRTNIGFSEFFREGRNWDCNGWLFSFKRPRIISIEAIGKKDSHLMREHHVHKESKKQQGKK